MACCPWGRTQGVCRAGVTLGQACEGRSRESGGGRGGPHLAALHRAELAVPAAVREARRVSVPVVPAHLRREAVHELALATPIQVALAHAIRRLAARRRRRLLAVAAVVVVAVGCGRVERHGFLLTRALIFLLIPLLLSLLPLLPCLQRILGQLLSSHSARCRPGSGH